MASARSERKVSQLAETARLVCEFSEENLLKKNKALETKELSVFRVKTNAHQFPVYPLDCSSPVFLHDKQFLRLSNAKDRCYQDIELYEVVDNQEIKSGVSVVEEKQSKLLIKEPLRDVDGRPIGVFYLLNISSDYNNPIIVAVGDYIWRINHETLRASSRIRSILLQDVEYYIFEPNKELRFSPNGCLMAAIFRDHTYDHDKHQKIKSEKYLVVSHVDDDKPIARYELPNKRHFMDFIFYGIAFIDGKHLAVLNGTYGDLYIFKINIAKNSLEMIDQFNGFIPASDKRFLRRVWVWPDFRHLAIHINENDNNDDDKIYVFQITSKRKWVIIREFNVRSFYTQQGPCGRSYDVVDGSLIFFGNTGGLFAFNPVLNTLISILHPLGSERLLSGQVTSKSLLLYDLVQNTIHQFTEIYLADNDKQQGVNFVMLEEERQLQKIKGELGKYLTAEMCEIVSGYTCNAYFRLFYQPSLLQRLKKKDNVGTVVKRSAGPGGP